MNKRKDFHFEPPESEEMVPLVIIGFENPDSSVASKYESILNRFENYENEITFSVKGDRLSIEVTSTSGDEKETIDDLDYDLDNLKSLENSDLRGMGLVFGHRPASDRKIIATRSEPTILVTRNYKVEIDL